MDRLYLYFDGFGEPVMTFDIKIMQDVYECCRALAMSFIIDGYCFRPYNDMPDTQPPHMEKWDNDTFREIYKNF